ncbi:MAG TPA: ABC transporter permease [Vicinamibacterales bacterium]|nr:ABC transporter permease [Vicinamibacterales bacterium]
MTSLLFDLRHAVRVLLRSPGVTFIAAFTLALAIGATTAVFSVVHGVLLRPLPYPSPHRLMALWEVNDRGSYARLADPNFTDFRERNRTFSAMAKYAAGVTSVGGEGEPTRETVAAVNRQFFEVLGVQPTLGRSFGPDDARLGAAPTVVVSHGYWVRSLESSRSLSALRLRIRNRTHQIVGVMPRGFQFPAHADLWVPVELDRENRSRTAHNYYAIGRLRDGVSEEQAAADLSAIARDIVRQAHEQGSYLLTDAAAVPLRTSLTGRVSSTLYILLVAVFFLLLVACANVTNLLLAQAAARQREIALRHALGAGPARLIRQFVAEALVLLTVSGLGGLLVALLGTSALLWLAPSNLPRLSDVSINRPVLVFAVALSAVVALALGLVTAARAIRRDPRATLVDARGEAGGTGVRAGRIIVAAQMAITVVLLVGAALLGRSLQRVLSVDPGFRTEGLVAMDLALPYSEDPAVKARLSVFYSDVFDRIRGIPGVDDVAAASAVPMDGGLPDGLFAMLSPGEAPETMDDLRTLFQQKERLGTADYCAVSSAYFRALGIPLIRGRVFDDRDGPGAPHVAVISESLARTQWPGGDPIGRTIEFGNMDGDLRPLTIVGIVGDTREYGPEQPPRPTVYVDLLQRPRFSATVVIRSAADPRAVIGAARGVLREVAPDVPPRFRTFTQIYSAALGSRYFNLTLVASFAGTALVLAVAGVYGVMAYNVTRRRREIGVRIALGATPGDVRRMILAQGLATTTAGVAVGLLGALGVTRTLESLLFGVTPTDPLTFAVVVAGLCAVAALACYVPARRATLTDPVEALRQE